MTMRLLIILYPLSVVLSNPCDSYPASVCNVTISDPRFLKTASERVIHLGVSLRIIQDNNNKESTQDFDFGFKNDIKTLFSSILALSTGATQHWIILTDKKSVQPASTVLRNLITKHVSENLIRSYMGRLSIRRVPKVLIDYIDLDEVPRDEKDKWFIRALQFYLPADMEGTKKYTDSLFYMGPLYHRIFPQLTKLISLDVGKKNLCNSKII